MAATWVMMISALVVFLSWQLLPPRQPRQPACLLTSDRRLVIVSAVLAGSLCRALNLHGRK
jgi:hypothetical protein